MALASVSELEAFAGTTLNSVSAALALDGASAAVLRAVEDAAIVWTVATVPADVKLIVLQAAARSIDNPMQNTAETVGNASRQVKVTGVSLTADELASVRLAAGLVPAVVPRAGSFFYC